MTNAPSAVGRVPEWTVGDRLRKARTSANLSADELAAILDCTAHTIRNYETGATTPKRFVLKIYAMRCGVSLEWLEGGTEPPDGNIAPVTLCYPANLLGWAS